MEVPHGQLSLHRHHSLNDLDVGLSLDGIASFDSPDFSLSVAPLHFSLSAPKLLNGAGLHLLRGLDGEIGISFDKQSSRHFFFLGKLPSAPKFSLNLKVHKYSFFLLFCETNTNCSLTGHLVLTSTKRRALQPFTIRMENSSWFIPPQLSVSLQERMPLLTSSGTLHPLLCSSISLSSPVLL